VRARRRSFWVARVAGVVVAILGVAAPAGAESTYGSIHAADAVLKHGCHRYYYRYAVQPPTDDWDLETWLVDPRGRRRGYGYFQTGGDPKQIRTAFRICSANVVPGTFTITAKLHWYDDPLFPLGTATEHTVTLDPAHFRLTRG